MCKGRVEDWAEVRDQRLEAGKGETEQASAGGDWSGQGSGEPVVKGKAQGTRRWAVATESNACLGPGRTQDFVKTQIWSQLSICLFHVLSGSL